MSIPNVAVIGLGKMGWGFEQDTFMPKPATHLAAWLELEKQGKVKVVGLCDVDRSKIPELETPRISVTNVEDLWSSMKGTGETIDIVSIATPTETHRQIAGICIGKNVRGILLEKPMASTPEEATKILTFAKRWGNVTIAVNHSRRWDPFWQKVVSQVKSRIGAVQDFVGIFSGDLMSVGVHMADLANWFGAKHPYLINSPGDYLLFEVQVMGKRGRLTVVNNGQRAEWDSPMPSMRFQGYSELIGVSDMTRSDIGVFNADMKTPILRACEDMIECVNAKKPGRRAGKMPRCTGADGRKAMETLFNKAN